MQHQNRFEYNKVSCRPNRYASSRSTVYDQNRIVVRPGSSTLYQISPMALNFSVPSTSTTSATSVIGQLQPKRLSLGPIQRNTNFEDVPNQKLPKLCLTQPSGSLTMHKDSGNANRTDLPAGVFMKFQPLSTLQDTSVTQIQTEKAATHNQMQKSGSRKIRILTGTAEKILNWHKTLSEFCYYELIASMVSIQQGTMRLQSIILLRDRKGPIFQVVYYVRDHINIENFCVGQMLRCVGRIVGPNIMHAFSIREATAEEIATLRRMCYISEHAISKALTK